jgi:predicted RNA binding protein YcfA (HicA-like mRNA interferase family)
VSLKNKNHNQIIKVLIKHYGFTVKRQSGSHIQLKHKDGRRVTVPRHNPIKVGVLKSIIEQANLTRRVFKISRILYSILSWFYMVINSHNYQRLNTMLLYIQYVKEHYKPIRIFI